MRAGPRCEPWSHLLKRLLAWAWGRELESSLGNTVRLKERGERGTERREGGEEGRKGGRREKGRAYSISCLNPEAMGFFFLPDSESGEKVLTCPCGRADIGRCLDSRPTPFDFYKKAPKSHTKKNPHKNDTQEFLNKNKP